ncbi:hypothetical protein M0805_003287 [Coniferiporia weirii]|nr:hypothetical protein M0805_003287 [Coniferiporia weirii]
MLFSRVVSSLVFFLTIGAYALASAADRRSTADVQAVFTNLKSSTDTILLEIKSAASSESANDDTITSLVTQLLASLNTAQSSLTALDTSATPPTKRQSEDEIAELIASIIGDISTSLDVATSTVSVTPIMASLITGVDATLAQTLTSVALLQPNILVTVDGLLGIVGVLLTTLGLILTLGALGL